MLLSAKNLYKQYVDKPILDHQDLSIEEGDRIGLIGVNGCGKSTLLKILGGKEDYDGEIITSKDLKIALLEQNPAFTKESVQEELEYRNSLSKHPAEAFRVKAIATRFELPYDQTKIDTLSGGMKRRLDLAAILLSDANLLLLD
ncbi:ATP-binding cassette domain-containing protein [Ileibacterium valens]|nr:ATP-binding cassette domain-containing protein [Ileibacterium valens]